MCSGSEEGSYLRLIDSWITQLKAQAPSRTCEESTAAEEEEEVGVTVAGRSSFCLHFFFFFITLKPRVECYKGL